ncbi:hypothetical protein BX666DRAFT_2021540 [Dichotomocladium elegans]|nr:hypothetical protein BX666DRAFT_2021540 [Dichotomocladium elegans]
MFFKPLVVACALLQASGLVSAAEYWESFKSNVNPKNITIPNIPQTTSKDESTQCKWYDASPLFTFNAADWPTPWMVATSNGMNTTAEFKALYNSIDWSKAPKIPVRRKTPDGSIDLSGYDSSDPDCWWSATTCTAPKYANTNPDIYSCPEPETWGLTFDDGPNCSHNAFYDYLEKQKLKASMFYVGSNVINWPYGAMRGVRDGHHIAQHTWSHDLMTTLSNQEVLAELYYTQKAIKMVTGVTPKYWRPAFGDVDDRVRWIATQLGLTNILWNLDTDDWAAGLTEPVEKIKKTYEDFITMGTNGTFAKSGNIVLMHEIDATTMDMALEYLPKIQKAYKRVVDVATCMNITYPYMEKTVKFDGIGKSSNATTSSTTKKSPASTAHHSTAASPSASKASENDPSAAPNLAASLSGLMVAAVVSIAVLV